MHRKRSCEALFTPTHGFSVLFQQDDTTCEGGEKNGRNGGFIKFGKLCVMLSADSADQHLCKNNE